MAEDEREIAANAAKPTQPVPLEYATPGPRVQPGRQGPPSWRPTVMEMIVVVGLVALLVSTLLPPLSYSRPRANAAKCASNLRQIGQCLLLDANDNQGELADTLSELLETVGVSADVFVCPCSTDERASGPTTRAVVADFANKGHCSYVYLGAGIKLPLIQRSSS